MAKIRAHYESGSRAGSWVFPNSTLKKVADHIGLAAMNDQFYVVVTPEVSFAIPAKSVTFVEVIE